LLGLAEFLGFRPGLPKGLVFGLQPLVLCPKRLRADATCLFTGPGLNYALGVRVDGRAALATLLRAPSDRSPGATEDGGGIANPLLNRSSQQCGEPPRSKYGLTWFIDDEAHLLKCR